MKISLFFQLNSLLYCFFPLFFLKAPNHTSPSFPLLENLLSALSEKQGHPSWNVLVSEGRKNDPSAENSETAHGENWKLPPFSKSGKHSSFTRLLVWASTGGKKCIWNEYSVTFHLTCRPLREKECCFCKSDSGLLGFTVPHSFSLAFALRPTPPSLSFSSNPHPTMSDSLNSTPAAHQTTKLIHLWPPTVKSGSNKEALSIPCLG